MSQGRSLSKHTVAKKLKWMPMEIYRVPLNPEQAVLSCCSLPGRGMAAEGFWQCDMCGGVSATGGLGVDAS